MKEPVLVVLAAGMGSRYGGMKQIDPVGPNNQLIIDYSIYDARRAGFKKVIFVIKHEIEDVFKEAIGNRLSQRMDVQYAYQCLDDLPAPFTVPEGRVKPWGTCHAVMAATDLIDGPFAVINADDFYGEQAYKTIYDYLLTHPDADIFEYCMVGYLLKNTVTEHGSVARGVCEKGQDDYLGDINERTRIEKFADGIKYTEDGENWIPLADDSVVSMNLWGFNASILPAMHSQFAAHLEKFIAENPLKSEFFIPLSIAELIAERKARVKILTSTEQWFGVTYQEDKPSVVAAIAQMTEEGKYPANLWA